MLNVDVRVTDGVIVLRDDKDRISGIQNRKGLLRAEIIAVKQTYVLYRRGLLWGISTRCGKDICLLPGQTLRLLWDGIRWAQSGRVHHWVDEI